MDSIDAQYHIVLKNQAGEELAILDNFDKISYQQTINDIGTLTLTVIDNGNDDRLALFDIPDEISDTSQYMDIDGRVEVMRAIPGCDLDFYVAYEGFYRKIEKVTNDDGVTTVTIIVVDYNDLLRRKIVAYKEGTIRAEKDAPSETAMKEYVEENLGPTADDTVVGRLYQGGFPDFTVEEDKTNGPTWTGSRPFENVLDVIKDIALFSAIDFSVEPNGNGFIFKTHKDQLGDDRTDVGLNVRGDGLNEAGNPAVVFNLILGNTSDEEYYLDHLGEISVVVILGEGDGSTRDTVTVANEDAIATSPWNILEVSRPAGDYDKDMATHSMTVAGQEILDDNQAEEVFVVTPLQQPSTLYGKHYFLGDRVVIQRGDMKRFKKITAVGVSIDDSGVEQVTLELADVPEMKWRLEE